jgi:hypothetical protein
MLTKRAPLITNEVFILITDHYELGMVCNQKK